MTAPAGVTAILDAARAGDAAEVARRVDWPLSGVARMARALHDVDDRDRAAVAASGLAELTHVDGSETFVTYLTGLLAAVTEVRPATAYERVLAIEALGAPDPPPGLTAAQTDQLRALADATTRLSDIWVAEGPGPTTTLIAIEPTTGQLVVPPLG